MFPTASKKQVEKREGKSVLLHTLSNEAFCHLETCLHTSCFANICITKKIILLLNKITIYILN